MVIGIFGESCTGKSTIAAELEQRMNATVYTGKDYLKLAKSQDEARALFVSRLKEHEGEGETLVYVISEPEHLALLPEKAVRVLVTAPLALIRERFAKRMKGSLPPPVAAMLEKKHGCFDREACDLHVKSGEGEPGEIGEQIAALCKTRP